MGILPELRRRRSTPWSFMPSSIPELLHLKKTEKSSKESSAQPERTLPRPLSRTIFHRNPLRMHPVDMAPEGSSITEDSEVPKKENVKKKKKTVRFDFGKKDSLTATTVEDLGRPVPQIVVTDDPNELKDDPEDRPPPDYNMLHPDDADMRNRSFTPEHPEHQERASLTSGSAQLAYYHLNNSVSQPRNDSDLGPSSHRSKLSHAHPDNHGYQGTFPMENQNQNQNQNQYQRASQPHRQMQYAHRSSSHRSASYVPWSYNQEYYPPSPFLRSVGRTSYSHPQPQPQPSRHVIHPIVSRGMNHQNHGYSSGGTAPRGHNQSGHATHSAYGDGSSRQSGMASAQSGGDERRSGVHPSSSTTSTSTSTPTRFSPSLAPISEASVDMLAKRANKKLPARYRRGRIREGEETED